MEALLKPDQSFLLHIDEINRADLAKVLCEAISLLEAGVDEKVMFPWRSFLASAR